MPKTSVWLADDVKAAAKDSGVPLGELVRRGLEAPPPDEGLARLAAEMAVLDIADRLGGALDKMRADLAEDIRAAVRDEIRDGVRSALRDAQGGSW